MKKIVTLLLLIFSTAVFAQERGERRESMNKDEMASLQAKRLTMQLDLNEEQQQKLEALFAERMEANEEMREKKQKDREEMMEDRKEMRKERMEMNEEQKAKLREILTEEQYTKWEQLQEKRRKGRNMNMQRRKN